MIPREAYLGVEVVAVHIQKVQVAAAEGLILFYPYCSDSSDQNATELILMKLLSSKSPRAKSSRRSLSRSRSRSVSSRSRSASKGHSVSRYS